MEQFYKVFKFTIVLLRPSSGLCALLLLLSISSVQAQKKPQYSQYMFNNYLINPAIAGIEQFADVKMGYRNQWSGIDGAPQTYYTSFHMGIFPKSTKMHRANQVRGDDYKNQDLFNPANVSHHGIGGYAFADRIGAFERFQLHAGYAYHIPLNDKISFSAGATAGITRFSLNTDKITLTDAIDPAIYGENYNNIRPNVALGLWLYSSKFYLGISVDDLLTNDFQFGNLDNLNSGSNRHLLITAAYDFRLSHEISFRPSFLMKWLTPTSPVTDFNLMMGFYDRVFTGASYRNTSDLILLCRFVLSPALEIGYSYDFTQTDLSIFTLGTHELLIGFRLKNQHKLLCPQNLW
ncbi:MAG: type IX secretion system membrane protein PorP/SprF [Cyclobacteriaceae bacterium]|nr:type IX secretion system membrane protein PorP/SprF [Cyclobacteriaceae bacterium]